jgi:hypothetical protein
MKHGKASDSQLSAMVMLTCRLCLSPCLEQLCHQLIQLSVIDNAKMPAVPISLFGATLSPANTAFCH